MSESTPATIRLTNRLVRWIDEKPFPTLPPHPDPLLDWVATVYELERDPFIIVANSATYFSVLIGAEEVVDLGSLGGRIFLGVEDYCKSNNAQTIYRKRIEPGFGGMMCSKIGNATLNTMVTHLCLSAERLLSTGRTLHEVANLINDRPFKSLNYQTPRECFRDLAISTASKVNGRNS